MLSQEECDCVYNEACMRIGDQRLTAEYGTQIYCSEDYNVIEAKPDSAECNYDYECASYLCDNNLCKTVQAKEHISPLKSAVYIAVSLLIILILLIILQKTKKCKTKDTKRKSFQIRTAIKSTKYKTKKDPLERELEKSVDEIKNLSKKH